MICALAIVLAAAVPLTKLPPFHVAGGVARVHDRAPDPHDALAAAAAFGIRPDLHTHIDRTPGLWVVVRLEQGPPFEWPAGDTLVAILSDSSRVLALEQWAAGPPPAFRRIPLRGLIANAVVKHGRHGIETPILVCWPDSIDARIVRVEVQQRRFPR